MSNAKRDDNYIPTLIGVSNADGSTPVTLYVDPITHRLLVSSIINGIDLAALHQTDLYTTTNGQTAFTLTQAALFIIAVVINGAPQTLTADYIFNGTITVTLNSGVPEGLPAYITYIHA